MGRYVAGRIAQAVLVVIAAWTVAYLIVYALPGDPISIMLAGSGGDSGYIDPGAANKLRRELGLDRPFPVGYMDALWGLLRGDLGISVSSGMPVAARLTAALPPTLALGALAVTIAVVGGAVIAFAASAARAGWVREALLALPPLAGSAPTFWVGLLLVQFFSFRLGLLPAFGDRGWQSLVLPALTLAVPAAAALAQVLVTSLHKAQGESFVHTARATGASRMRTLVRHAGRAAAAAPLTVLGQVVGGIVAGAVVVETVFSRRGIGRLTADAVANQDLPVVLGVVVLAAAAFVIVNLLVDLVLPFVDPRIGRARVRGAGR